ncbi:MAG: RNA polymerase sigma factor [Planctomycetota bacterium]|jgi:RNA polymerase sigma-70 factor (ECF subfamily)
MEDKLKKDFEKIWLQTSNRIRAYMFCSCGNWTEADDLLQDCYLRAFQRWGQFNGTGSRQAWIFAIARNICIDHFRGLRKQTTVVNNEIFTEPGITEDRNEKMESIWNIINSTADEYQEVIYLRFAADLDYKEIAESLKIPIGTVRSRLHRGLKVVKEKLQEHKNGT